MIAWNSVKRVYFKVMANSYVEKSKAFNSLVSPMVSGMGPIRLEELGVELVIGCFADFINEEKVSIVDHEHPLYEFVWMVKGDMTYLVDGKKMVNSEDNAQIFFLPPGRLHRRYTESELSIIRSIELGIDPVNAAGAELVKELNRILESRGYCLTFTPQQQARLQSLEQTLFRGGPLCTSLVRYELAVFLIDIIRNLLPDDWTAARGATEPSYSRNEITDYIIMRIDDLVNRPFDLDIFAGYFNLSGRHLNRVFFDKYRMSIRKYAAMRRLHHAERLLQNPANSVGDVANALGFNSASYFISFFKKHKKITPGEFVSRRQNQK